MFRTTGNLKKHIQKTHEEKVQFLWEKFSGRRQFEQSHTKNTCDEEKIATFIGKYLSANSVGKFSKTKAI